MTPKNFLRETWATATDTTAYLLAYRGALILAVLAGALTRWLGSMPRVSRIRATRAGAVFAGFVTPSAKADLGSVVRAMRLHRGRSLPFLVATHVLTPYHLILLGPLLGKDALLSVVLGGVIAVIVAAALGRVVDWPHATDIASPDDAADPITLARAVAREIARNGPSILYGLLAGGAIAAWGVSSWAVAPATLCEGRMAAQLLNAVIGVGIALLLNPSPAAMPFIGTYLWKTGLAHAGLVAFFCAAPITPARFLQFRRELGMRATVVLTVLLAGSAIASGMITALLYRISGMTIHYKLIPEQLLS